jgi:hypothetical protein
MSGDHALLPSRLSRRQRAGLRRGRKIHAAIVENAMMKSRLGSSIVLGNDQNHARVEQYTRPFTDLLV